MSLDLLLLIPYKDNFKLLRGNLCFFRHSIEHKPPSMITAEHILSWNFFLRWYSIIRDIIVTFLIHCADPSRKPSAFYHYEIKLLIGNFKRCLTFIFIQGFEPLGLARSIWQNWSWASIKALYEMPPVTPKVVSTPTITVQNKFTANFSLKDSSYEIENFYSPKFFLKWDS